MDNLISENHQIISISNFVNDENINIIILKKYDIMMKNKSNL